MQHMLHRLKPFPFPQYHEGVAGTKDSMVGHKYAWAHQKCFGLQNFNLKTPLDTKISLET
jgi:hypothetical protein